MLAYNYSVNTKSKCGFKNAKAIRFVKVNWLQTVDFFIYTRNLYINYTLNNIIRQYTLFTNLFRKK